MQSACGLGDLLRLVADALEVGGGLDRGEHQAQVAGGRLLAGDDVGAGVVELDLGEVDLLVALNDRFEQLDVTAAQSVQRLRHLGFHQTAHLQHAATDFLQFGVELPESVFGHFCHDLIGGSVHASRSLLSFCCVKPG